MPKCSRSIWINHNIWPNKPITAINHFPWKLQQNTLLTIIRQMNWLLSTVQIKQRFQLATGSRFTFNVCNKWIFNQIHEMETYMIHWYREFVNFSDGGIGADVGTVADFWNICQRNKTQRLVLLCKINFTLSNNISYNFPAAMYHQYTHRNNWRNQDNFLS